MILANVSQCRAMSSRLVEVYKNKNICVCASFDLGDIVVGRKVTHIKWWQFNQIGILMRQLYIFTRSVNDMYKKCEQSTTQWQWNVGCFQSDNEKPTIESTLSKVTQPDNGDDQVRPIGMYVDEDKSRHSQETSDELSNVEMSYDKECAT